jgi:hypothetical protein
MNLAGIDVTNGGVPFGVRVQTGIQKLTVGISGKGIKVFNVTNATSVADALAKAGVTDTVDFAVLVDP